MLSSSKINPIKRRICQSFSFCPVIRGLMEEELFVDANLRNIHSRRIRAQGTEELTGMMMCQQQWCYCNSATKGRCEFSLWRSIQIKLSSEHMISSSMSRNRCSYLNFIKKCTLAYLPTCQRSLSNWTRCSIYRVVSSENVVMGYRKKNHYQTPSRTRLQSLGK